MTGRNPIEALAHLRHEFGEHGGVNMSIEASSTFTVREPGTMPEMFQGLKGHDAGCYLYSGMSDVIAGAVCGSGEFIESLMDLHTGSFMLLGPTMDPKVASKISLRIPHLPIRMAAHGERALAMAERLYDGGVNVGYTGTLEQRWQQLKDALEEIGAPIVYAKAG